MNSANQNQPAIDLFESGYQLIAICENSGTCSDAISPNIIFLGKGFNNLDARDQLIVIKSSIHTHYQVMKGETKHGKIIYYQFVDNVGVTANFDIDGKLDSI